MRIPLSGSFPRRLLITASRNAAAEQHTGGMWRDYQSVGVESLAVAVVDLDAPSPGSQSGRER
jgi:hypothetical protein